MKHLILNTHKSLTGLLILLEVVTVVLPVVLLGKYFNFPDILRQPAQNAFSLFKAHEFYILIGYYSFLISALVFTPLSYTLKYILQETTHKFASNILVGLGLLTTIFQGIGFVRWIFVMPYLTTIYFENIHERPHIILMYEVLNRYVGMSIGEHLGFLAMGFWTICVGIMLIYHKNFPKWIGYTGILLGFLLIVSILEHFGGKNGAIFGTINFLANTFWTFWLLFIAIFIKLK